MVPIEESAQWKPRIALMLDDDHVPNWVYTMIERVIREQSAEISLLVIKSHVL